MLNLDSSIERATPAAVSVALSQTAEAARSAATDVLARAEEARRRSSIEAELEHVAVLGYN
jgi:hypothetical protein